MTDVEAALTERRRNIEQERAYNSLMLELEEMERRLKNDRLKAGADPAGLAPDRARGAGAAAEGQADGGASTPTW